MREIKFAEFYTRCAYVSVYTCLEVYDFLLSNYKPKNIIKYSMTMTKIFATLISHHSQKETVST